MPLGRALSKLGVLSRQHASLAIRAGRVTVRGRVVRDQAHLVSLTSQADIEVDGAPCEAPAWRTVAMNKPRGVVTTSSDPAGRRTVFDVLGGADRGLKVIGRLDLASSGLLLLTTDTRLAAWLTDPAHGIRRLYVVTVRGRMTDEHVRTLIDGVTDRGQTLRASAARALKVSGRETHLLIELREGRNREIRRLLEATGHAVTRLKRVAFGGIELGDLPPGASRPVTRAEVAHAFPGCPLTQDGGHRAATRRSGDRRRRTV